MKKKYRYLTIILFFNTVYLFGQYYNVYSNYLLNLSALNVAAIGKDEALDVNLYSRKQWTGFIGSPLTTNISANTMIKRPSVNVGFFLQNDRIGVASNYYLNGQYAYRIKFKTFKLSFGISAGMQLLNNNTDKLRRVTENDDVINNTNLRNISFSTGFGIFAHNKKYFCGISIPYLYTYQGFSLTKTPIYFIGGLMINTTKKDFIKPSILVRQIDGYQWTIDLNVSYYFLSQFGVGLSYRYNNALVGLLEYKVNDQFKVAYCYDFAISKMSKYQSGSHEISLRYLFGKKYKTKNPRALNY